MDDHIRGSHTGGNRVDRHSRQSTVGTVHDLGNLIQIASSALNRIARDPDVKLAQELEPVIASAKTALQQAGALVRETIGRAHELRREIGPADVGGCLAEIETLVRCACEPHIRLEVRLEPGLPPAKCDHLGLQNAVLNLVFNARDAMPDGGLITIEAATAVQSGATLIELRVGDGGIGMTQETVNRAFEPFFTTKGKGLGGVGLPMVKHFAEAHHGSVEIESTLGSGTTVILRLPAALSGVPSGSR
ncbi:hypothetical protein AU467_02470 [Mesorhizobium loti]|uniref:histidine kinase n=1 Tax=Rhizobium loti TaxID=381 RepID=A0A101KUT8_RHILI|nr:hypothetical protein AU467_02470 [Mesorhizobium loti]